MQLHCHYQTLNKSIGKKMSSEMDTIILTLTKQETSKNTFNSDMDLKTITTNDVTEMNSFSRNSNNRGIGMTHSEFANDSSDEIFSQEIRKFSSNKSAPPPRPPSKPNISDLSNANVTSTTNDAKPKPPEPPPKPKFCQGVENSQKSDNKIKLPPTPPPKVRSRLNSSLKLKSGINLPPTPPPKPKVFDGRIKLKSLTSVTDDALFDKAENYLTPLEITSSDSQSNLSNQKQLINSYPYHYQHQQFHSPRRLRSQTLPSSTSPAQTQFRWSSASIYSSSTLRNSLPVRVLPPEPSSNSSEAIRSSIEEEPTPSTSSQSRYTRIISTDIPLPELPGRKFDAKVKKKPTNVFIQFLNSFKSIFFKSLTTPRRNAIKYRPDYPETEKDKYLVPTSAVNNNSRIDSRNSTSSAPAISKAEQQKRPGPSSLQGSAATDLSRNSSSLHLITTRPETLRVTPGGLMATNRVIWQNHELPKSKIEHGTVQWVGKIKGDFWAGVVFDNPIGNSSGLYGYGNGLQVRLFECKLGYGRFIRVQELMLYSEYYINEGSGIICLICREDFVQPPEILNADQNNIKDEIINNDENDEISNSRNMTATKCGHLFHSGCLNQWFKTNKKESINCPSCLKEVCKNDVIRIFPAQVN